MFSPTLAGLHEELVNIGLVEPVSLETDDERAWLDCDLASLAEHRLGDPTDPRGLEDDRRSRWITGAAAGEQGALRGREEYQRCYWLLDGGARVGTLAIDRSARGGRRIFVSSFYVFPQCRGVGVGGRALVRLREALAPRRLGVGLETYWTWQRAVRFYLRRGMWVYMWKRELSLFSSPGTPLPIVALEGDVATLSVSSADRTIVLARATRRGDLLDLEGPAPELSEAKELGSAYWHASSTLALYLALEGWPLRRSDEAWQKHRHDEGDAPEGLANKIRIWEANDRAHSWLVDTPRIPGLDYPSWAELEAEWAAELAAYEAQRPR